MSDGRLDLRDRDGLFAALEAERFDVAVIGGGITGAGVAREAALRGLSVALVEARDFASGTSSRSSKLIHGGLRYLAQGDLGLVREAASERKVVEAIAPHLARETPFVIPARTAAGIARLRAGLWTFEKLGGVPKRRRHQLWSREELKAREPAVRAEGLAGAVVYPEFVTDDARLTLANIRSAAAAGAVVANYAPVEAIVAENGRAAGLAVAEGLSGAPWRHAHVRARVIVNAAGAWADTVRALEDPAAAPKLELTRGIHLVLPRTRLPISRTIVMTAADGRGVFAVPRGPMAYVGTTDTFFEAPEPWPPILEADVDYLLAALGRTFEAPPIGRVDITSAWSGLRPLVGQPGKGPSEISRRDELMTGPAGVLTIAGGKLTAFRRMAERVVDAVETALGRPPGRSKTASEPLVGSDVDLAAALKAVAACGVGDGAAERLVDLYGSEAETVAAAGGGPAAEATHAVLAEGALRLEDWWTRRSARAWFDPDAGLSALAEAGGAMAPLLGWSPDRVAAEIGQCRARRQADMAALGTTEAASA
ncbi:MAG TPA: glycerol-3-phosphate dehydrogenase/oxidase [Caulobacteraceae bacterium]|nr:glycerol-3-phosphate dehydrogenase/oxidase [Caulobacteraceae bacterium]